MAADQDIQILVVVQVYQAYVVSTLVLIKHMPIEVALAIVVVPSRHAI